MNDSHLRLRHVPERSIEPAVMHPNRYIFLIQMLQDIIKSFTFSSYTRINTRSESIPKLNVLLNLLTHLPALLRSDIILIGKQFPLYKILQRQEAEGASFMTRRKPIKPGLIDLSRYKTKIFSYSRHRISIAKLLTHNPIHLTPVFSIA